MRFLARPKNLEKRLGCGLKATLDPAHQRDQGVNKQPRYWDRSEAYNGNRRQPPLVCAVERLRTVSQKGAGNPDGLAMISVRQVA
jgi:hypothetical protein